MAGRKLERRRLEILARPLGKRDGGMGPGDVASEREARESGGLQCPPLSFCFLVDSVLHDGG